MMNEIIEYIKDCLALIQTDYNAEESNPGADLTLINTTARPGEMYTAIVSATNLRARLNQRGVTLKQLHFTDRSVILECTLANGQ